MDIKNTDMNSSLVSCIYISGLIIENDRQGQRPSSILGIVYRLQNKIQSGKIVFGLR